MASEKRSNQIFISHSSKDKWFTNKLASDLRNAGLKVWFDAWAIGFGDSIVEKVFAGLSESDKLLIVLSENSLGSKWVSEELNVSVMRKLTSNNIRIIPVRIDESDVPDHLAHLRYADFRKDYNAALKELVDALAPIEELWSQLEAIYEEFIIITSHIKQAPLNSPAADRPQRLHDLLEKALSTRVEIEKLESGVDGEKIDRMYADAPGLFKNLQYLRSNGVDARSAVWHALVNFNSMLAHASPSPDLKMDIFVEMLDETGYFAESIHASGLRRPPIFQEEYDSLADKNDAIRLAMRELNCVIELLCRKPFVRRDPYRARD